MKAKGTSKSKFITKFPLITLGIVLILVVAVILLIFENLNHSTNKAQLNRNAISDEDRINDLLEIEKTVETYLKEQNVFGEARKMPQTLQVLKLDNLKGHIKEYEYSEAGVGRFGYGYIICTNFDKGVGKFSNGVYPDFSQDKASNLYTTPYYAHRAGRNCFNMNRNEVKGTSRELVGSSPMR